MRMTHILVLSALTLLLTCSQVGCASAKTPGEEKSNFLTGTNTLVQADCVATTNAAKEVAEDLKLSVEKNQATMLDGKIVARSATRMKLVVTVKTAGENLSRVTVRAGGFGNRDIQKQVLERMRAKLPQVESAEQPYAQVTAPQGQGASRTAPQAQTKAPQGQAMTPAQQQPAQQPTAQLPF